MNNIHKHTASLALFGKLYDLNKDIVDVIISFIKDFIMIKSLHTFSLEELTNAINEYYGFNIPTAVIKNALKKIATITKHRQQYTVTYIDEKDIKEFREQEKTVEDCYKYILESLFEYVQKKGLDIKDIIKEKIESDLSNFLHNKTNGNEYFPYISTFFIENKTNPQIQEHLNILRDGTILNTALRCSNDTNYFKEWHNNLTIFLDTEILFHLIGYNGELFQKLSYEFLEQIREINKRNKKEVIKLFYFEEIKKEINSFFHIAELIVTKKIHRYVHPVAMTSIINGCKNASDVQNKKADFITFLKKEGIREDTYNSYFSSVNANYNILSDEEIERIRRKTNTQEKDIELEDNAITSLTYLNYVAIRRGDSKYSNFENIKHIFLTGNKETLTIASKKIREEKEVPLATSMDFLTSKFWVKLNKGLGDDKLKNFDIITKSQITLSRILNDSIGEKYDELQKEINEKKLDDETIIGRVTILRDKIKKPEEIEKNEIANDILEFIQDEDIYKYVETQSLLRNKVNRLSNEYGELNTRYASKIERDKELIQSLENSVRDKMTKLDIAKNSLSSIKSKLESLNEQTNESAQLIIKIIGIFSFITYVCIIIFAVIYKDIIVDYLGIEKYNYFVIIIPIIIPVIPYLIFWITGKSWRIKDILLMIKHRIENYTKKRKLVEFNNLDEEANKLRTYIEDLNLEMIQLQDSIERLKK